MEHTESVNVKAAVEAAEVLARAIQATPEWKELQNAQLAFERDAELQEIILRYRQLAQAWRTAQQRGQGLMGTAVMELPRLQSQIEASDTYQRVQQASRAVVVLLQRVNEAISAELGVDFAANAAPRGGGGGGCCG